MNGRISLHLTAINYESETVRLVDITEPKPLVGYHAPVGYGGGGRGGE